MRTRPAALLTLALLLGCRGKPGEPSPADPHRTQHDASARSQPPAHQQHDAATPAASPPPAARATKLRHELVPLRLPERDAQVHHFTLPLADVALAHIDLKYQTPLVEALGGHDLVINGGYWGYRGQERVIEGLLVVNDQQIAPKHKHGGVLELRLGGARVVRGEDFMLAPGTTLALQCSPRLVDAGKPIPKLESQRRAPRTALCVTHQRSQLEAYLTDDPITLPELALFLVRAGCLEALNLDGGPSTAAVARLHEGVLTIGRGEALPYGLGFTFR